MTSSAQISVGRRAASGWPKSCIAAGRRCIEGVAQGRARSRSPGRSTSVTWTASNRCQMNSGQQLSLGYRTARHQKGLWDANARGNFFGMRKMPGVGDKWGCVPPRPFAPPACLTTRHKGAPSQHPGRCTWTEKWKLSICQRARERQRSCYFFSLPCAFLSSGAQGKLIFYVRSIKLWGSREILEWKKMIMILAWCECEFLDCRRRSERRIVFAQSTRLS